MTSGSGLGPDPVRTILSRRSTASGERARAQRDSAPLGSELGPDPRRNPAAALLRVLRVLRAKPESARFTKPTGRTRIHHHTHEPDVSDTIIDDERLRAILAELSSAPGADAVVRVQRYGEHDGDEGYLIGNRAGLLRIARACLEAALAPHAPREHPASDAAYIPDAEIVATAPLFDMRSGLSITGVGCEEPLVRVDAPTGPARPMTLLQKAAGVLGFMGCLACVALLLLGAVTFVGWFT